MEFDTSTIIGIVVLVFILSGILYVLFKPWWDAYLDSPERKKEIQKLGHIKKIEKFQDKIKTLETVTKTSVPSPIPKRSYQKERELYELYYKGIPDTYNLDNILIPGVEPDAKKAIEYLNLVINSTDGHEQDFLNLAKIYHYGMHKFERNLDKAEQIYLNLKHQFITEETWHTIVDALADINKIRVYSWLNLPMNDDDDDDEPRPPAVQPPRNHQENIQVHQNIVPNHVPNQDVQHLINRRNLDEEVVDHNAKNYDDPQNTHNPQVLATIRHSLNNLKASTKLVKSPEETFAEIRTYLYNLKDSDKKDSALRSLNKIQSEKTKLSSTDMTGIDALQLVWNRMHDTDRFDASTNKNLKENLFDELADMQEHGTTVCPTGVFTHIVDTLSGVDSEVMIKPTYAINEEMMTRAAHIRTEMLSSVPEEERQSLEMGTSPKQDDFDTSLKNTILTTLKNDYVHTGILKESKFDMEVNKWISEI